MSKTTPKLLKPREIARLGLIKNTMQSESEDSNYAFILSLITSGELKAKNVGKGSRAYYLVSETEIARYNRTGFVKQS